MHDLRDYYTKHKGRPLSFIVKPDASCQGKGIFLCRRLEDIPKDKGFIVQRYIR
jgi:predicted ATP-grasp superfamily ATP-dependent carboligase